MAVVVLDEDSEHHLQLAAVEDQHPVEALSADSAHEAFGKGVGPRGLDRRTDDPYLVCAEDLVKAWAELCISVPH